MEIKPEDKSIEYTTGYNDAIKQLQEWRLKHKDYYLYDGIGFSDELKSVLNSMSKK